MTQELDHATAGWISENQEVVVKPPVLTSDKMTIAGLCFKAWFGKDVGLFASNSVGTMTGANDGLLVRVDYGRQCSHSAPDF